MLEPLSPAASRSVLLLDADQPSALAITRALGRHGVSVQVSSSVARPLAASSRYATGCLHYPDPLRREAEFIAWLDAHMRDNPVGLVIPVTERTVVPILRHRAQLDDRRIAIAPSSALEQVLDKDLTLQLAVSLGIPVPRSMAIDTLDALPEAAAQIGFPVVVKPSRSVGQSDGQRVQLSVSYAHNSTELEAQVRHALRYGAVILQEYFRGDGVGIELIADSGTVRYAFQHRRLHEVPLTGGGSSLRISEAIVPALRAAAEQLMQALGWHGVAMVEFKYAPASGEFRLMEINGRFWGSLPLAVAAGADFPVMLHELMTTGRVGDRAPARLGVVCRQLARDIDWLEHVLRRAAPPQLVQLPSMGEVLRDSLLVFSPRHHFDVQSLSDPKPGVVDLWRIGERQWGRVAAAWRQRRQLDRERQAGHPGGTGRRVLAHATTVLFICYGNINRSALAHVYAQRQYGTRFRFASAGFHVPDGRPVDPVMVDVAGSQGIDMTMCRSRTVDAVMVSDADVIFVMEIAHLERLRRGFPAAHNKVFLLGASAATHRHEVEVTDPYGQARSAYAHAFRRITRAVDDWFGGVDSTTAPQPSAAHARTDS